MSEKYRPRYCRLCGMKINDGNSHYCDRCRKKINENLRPQKRCEQGVPQAGSGLLGSIVVLLLLLYALIFKK